MTHAVERADLTNTALSWGDPTPDPAGGSFAQPIQATRAHLKRRVKRRYYSGEWGVRLSIDSSRSRTDLRGANLRGANLTNADLSGANLKDANLSGAIGITEAKSLQGAIMPNGQKYEDLRKDIAGRIKEMEDSGPS